MECYNSSLCWKRDILFKTQNYKRKEYVTNFVHILSNHTLYDSIPMCTNQTTLLYFYILNQASFSAADE
jgi:hypothetical protein